MFGALFLGGLELLLFIFVLAPLGLACLVFWVWMLIDAIKSRALSDTEKLIWVLVILFTHLLGAAIYFFVGRSPNRRVPAG